MPFREYFTKDNILTASTVIAPFAYYGLYLAGHIDLARSHPDLFVWTRPDVLAHFSLSFGLSSTGRKVSAWLDRSPITQHAAGAALATVFQVGKELYDIRRGVGADFMDTLGYAAGLTLDQTRAYLKRKSTR